MSAVYLYVSTARDAVSVQAFIYEDFGIGRCALGRCAPLGTLYHRIGVLHHHCLAWQYAHVNTFLRIKLMHFLCWILSYKKSIKLYQPENHNHCPITLLYQHLHFKFNYFFNFIINYAWWTLRTVIGLYLDINVPILKYCYHFVNRFCSSFHLLYCNHIKTT